MELRLQGATVEQMPSERIRDFLAWTTKSMLRFPDSVAQVAMEQIEALVTKGKNTGEEVIAVVADHFGVRFEEVRSHEDARQIKAQYLEKQGELGFGVLDEQLQDPNVDALLFQLTKAKKSQREKFVAVLNLQQTAAKAYWNRAHELSHRICEPPQKTLPFRRHRIESQNPVETLVDHIAGKIAFYEPLLRKHLQKVNRSRLSFGTIRTVRESYAPSASLMSTTLAVAKLHPQPCVVLEATLRGRKRKPTTDVALRVKVYFRSSNATDCGLCFIDNWRVPPTSPLYSAFYNGGRSEGIEDLSEWKTSCGNRLPKHASSHQR